jgi:pyruvate,orthophosphate dikinase
VPGLTGELLWQAQGEAVVAGAHATEPLAALAERLPAVHAALEAATATLEHRYRDLVDVEFTIESGRLFLLQARPGKRSRAAAARVAVDLTAHPAIRLSRAEALARTQDQLAGAPPRTRAAGATPIAHGLPASPGLATGRLALTPDDALEMAEDGPVILVRAETSPEDVHGMGVSAGLLTTLGGPLSHAALVAREWGIPAVVGAIGLKLDARGFTVLGRRIAAGDVLSIDGSTGEVFAGEVAGEIIEDPHAATLRRWAEEERA